MKSVDVHLILASLNANDVFIRFFEFIDDNIKSYEKLKSSNINNIMI